MNKSLIDPLNHLKQKEVAVTAFKVIDRIQQEPPALQVQAMATLFLILVDTLGLDARRELDRAGFIMKDADKKYCEHFKVVQAYVEGELNK